MHWQEAAKQSRYGYAVRLDKRGVWYRHGGDGTGFLCRRGYPMRDAKPEEVEGYDDWLPEV
tara:strand:+ start:3272 stop:3454 length:183 start_codon:yes stop_codon:yes gene_type:complete